ncbi:MAG: hypothetical protein ACI4I9_01565 [Porcipelethomonas sp.]
MNMDDYKRAANRLEASDKCRERVMNMSIKGREKKKYSKRKLIPVIAAAAAGFTVVTAVSADSIIGIFKKQRNFEMNITCVEEPEKTEVKIMNAVPKEWDEEIIHSIFTEGNSIIETDETPSDMNPEKTWKFFRLEDDSFLSFEDGSLSWTDGKDRITYSYSGAAQEALDGIDSGKVTLEKQEIEDFDRASAEALADDIVNRLNIPVASKEIYVLDEEFLKSYDLSRNENGERIYKHGEILPEWTEEQEAYLIVYHQDGGGLPVSARSTVYNDSCVEGSRVYAVISRSGLEEFEARPVYDVSESGEAAEICTAEEAAGAIDKKFADETASYPTSIENCHLVYLPVTVEFGKSYELRPFWEFYSTKTITSSMDSREPYFDIYGAMFVDAQTLEIIE